MRSTAVLLAGESGTPTPSLLDPHPPSLSNPPPTHRAESSILVSRGGRFAIDLTALQPFARSGSPLCSSRGSGDLGGYGLWPFRSYHGFVVSAVVQGEGRCSRLTVEVGVPHVGCTKDAAAFVALAAAVDLSMDACRLFSHCLRRELSNTRSDLGQ